MKPTDVRKIMGADIRFTTLPHDIQAAVVETLSGERADWSKAPEYINVADALTAYLAWEGIIGYTEPILALFKTALSVAQLEGSTNEQGHFRCTRCNHARSPSKSTGRCPNCNYAGPVAVNCPPDPATVAFALAGRSPPYQHGSECLCDTCCNKRRFEG